MLRAGLVSAALLAACTAAAVLAVPVAAAASPGSYVCSTGSATSPALIPAGSYGSVMVTGSCYMEGTYTIAHGLTVAPGAELDASVYFGFYPYTYGKSCDVSVTVSGGVRVMQGGVLYLGNGEGTGCPSSNDVVNGGITAAGAATFVVHGTTVNGRLSATGGDPGAGCTPSAASPFGTFTDVEDSMLNGGATLSGNSTCWMGFIRNHVNGKVTVSGNTLGDPDAIEIGANTIDGSLACSGNALAFFDINGGGVPTNMFDGSGPFRNTVSGAETGQCAGL